MDKCPSCLICKVDGREGMSLCFCMLSSLVLYRSPGTRPVHDGFRRLSTGSCTIRFGWIVVLCRLNLSYTERFSFVRKLYYRISFLPLFMIMVTTILTGSRGASHVHRDMALSYHQLFAPQLIRVYRPYVCVCGDVHRSHLLL